MASGRRRACGRAGRFWRALRAAGGAAALLCGGAAVGSGGAAASALQPVVTSVAPDSGPPGGGTPVQVTGSGLLGATAVLFGATEASGFTVESDNRLLAVSPPSPAGAGAVDVRVVTPSGTSAASSADVFLYSAVPQVDAVIPAAGPVAGGTTVTILGSGFTAAEAVGFGPAGTAPFKVISDTEIVATVPALAVSAPTLICDFRGRCRQGTASVPAATAEGVDVTVRAPAGTSAVVPGDRFTYLPAPAVGGVDPATGGPGTAVTISGQGLGGATSVTFGDRPAAFRVVSDQELAATVPPGAGTVPVTVSDLPRVTAAAVGGDTAYAVESDGSLWAWGLAAPAPAGAAAAVPGCGCSDVPVAVAGLRDVVAVAAGASTTYALEADGRVFAWGAGGEGQLGDGLLTDSSAPVEVHGLTGVVAIAAGADDGYALEADGRVFAWGGDAFGELGSLAAWKRRCLCSPTPVPVPGLPAARAIAAGAATAYALGPGGTVWAWGDGTQGQLGDGALRDIAPPAPVRGVSGATAIAAGQADGYALLAGGAVWAWGDDGQGQLGYAWPASPAACACRAVPGPVPGLPAAVAVAAGGDTGYAVDSGGSVWAWGDGAQGQLGDGAEASSPAPVAVAGLTGVVGLAAGGATALAWTPDGALWGWGDGADGQLGPSALGGAPAPVPLPFWSDASAAGPSAAFTYVPGAGPAPAASGAGPAPATS